jgi:hypothetical protein
MLYLLLLSLLLPSLVCSPAGADGVMSAEPLLMNPMLFDAAMQPQDVSCVLYVVLLGVVRE